MLSANEQRVESKLYEDMTPISFNVPVYLMDSQPEKNEAINASPKTNQRVPMQVLILMGRMEDCISSSTSFVMLSLNVKMIT